MFTKEAGGIIASVCWLLCAGLLGFLAACGSGEDSEAIGRTAESGGEVPAAADTSAQSHAECTPADLRSFAYDGDDGSYIVAHLHEDGDEITLFLPGQTIRLPRVPSASGVKYGNETHTFWMKGSQATLELEEEKIINCIENRRRSRIEDSKLRGNDYWATGNEPGWTLEIGPKTTVLVTDYGKTRFEFPTPQPRVDPEGRRATYRGRDGDVRIVIRIVGEPCSDSMSGESFESRVEVQVGDERLTGCGQALH